MANTLGKSGKFRDPVFVSMVLAMALAIASSVALRMVAHLTGPSSAQAAESTDDTPRESLPPLPKLPPHQPPK